MAEQELWTELLKQAQGRYQIMNEVFRLTQEMSDALSRDDRVAAQMLLEMRQNELDQLSESEELIFKLLECASREERGEILELLKGERSASPEDSFEKQKLGEIGINIRRNLGRIVKLDQVVSTRLAGKDSFYQKP